MKLLQQTGRYFLIFSLVALFIGGTALFLGLQYMLDHEMDESLSHTRAVLHRELSKRDSLPTTIEIMDEVIDIHPTIQKKTKPIFKDTVIIVVEEEDGEKELEAEPFRQYIYTEQIKGKYYRIALNHSKFHQEHLLTAIGGLIIGLLGLFLIVINLFNRFLSVRMWQPFYQIVEQVKQFNISKNEQPLPIATNIDEFKMLDGALQKMTKKIINDYRSLKQFTENASHEMQTPLAIIQSQIELLSQKDHLDEKTLQQLQQIQYSTTRLSKLNQSLLLLTRIENRQFKKVEALNLKELILQKLVALELLLDAKNIKVTTDLSAISITANAMLIDILISNLLSNAIKHNLAEGEIILKLTAEKLTIKNLGIPLSIAPETLFERFRKSDDSAKSVGLGLAIVKEICEVYGWRIAYRNDEDWHEMVIIF